MIDHAALADAIVEPTFPPLIGGALDHRADEHLATCRECRSVLAGVRADAARISAFQAGEPSPWVHRAVIRATRPAFRWGVVGKLLVYAVLAVGLAWAGVAGAGAFLDTGPTIDQPPAMQTAPLEAALAGKPLAWKAPSAVFAADQVTIVANGAVLHPPAHDLKVGGDPGAKGLTGPSIELAWSDGSLEQRMNIYFTIRNGSWSVREIRVYDNVAPQPDWATLPTPSIGAPLGLAAVGNVDITGAGRAGPVRVQITGLVLSVSETSGDAPGKGGPANGFAKADPVPDPFGPGGDLHCSGILQLAPRDAEQELARRGMKVIWQVPVTSGPKPGMQQQPRAPEVGWISSSGVEATGEVVIVVENPANPDAPPVAFPADCPPPPSPTASG